MTESGTTIERGRGTKTFFRIARPDLLYRVAKAVVEIDQVGDLDKNFACEVFGTCGSIEPRTEADKFKSRHSKTYLVCKEDNWLHASNILQGVSEGKLPGFLKDQGDSNVLCEIAHFVADLLSEVILNSVGLPNKRCVVQEQFINQQRVGAMTKHHVHPDDSYGPRTGHF
jgi:hypothetical protein